MTTAIDFRSRNAACFSRSWATGVLLTLVCGSTLAMADAPASLDRIPANAAMAMSIRNMEQLAQRMSALSTLTGQDELEGNPLSDIQQLLGTPGLNKSGSAALIVMPGAHGKLPRGGADGEDAPESVAVALVPVSDYAAFVTALGAPGSDGIQTVMVDDEENFVRDAGGGYAVLGKTRDAVEAFKSEAGQSAAHMKAMGAQGRRTADIADILMIASIPAIQEQIKERGDAIKEQAEMMGQMGGADIGPAAAFGEIVMNTFARDGQVGVIGVGLGEKGVWLDIGAQFKEGSELASFFTDTGKSASLLSRVPAMTFLLAGAFDLSAPGIKTIIRNVNEMNAKTVAAGAKEAGEMLGGEAGADAVGAFANFASNVDQFDGGSFVVGASPGGLMGGLLINTTMFFQSKDPAKSLASAKEAMLKSNGQAVGGMTMKTTYVPAAAEISGVKVDKWTTEIQSDPDDPNAGSIAMMQAFMYGQGPIGGFSAAVDNGLVMTMSQNTPLITRALAAAKGEKGLTTDEQIKASQALLPEGRTFELFVGSKSVMDTVGGFLAMMGGAAEFEIPVNLPPIAMGGTTDGGGVSTRIYFPHDVLKTFAEVAKAMQPEGDGMDGGDGEAPTF